MICKYCSYEWEPRKENPKACPRCKRRFDYGKIGGNFRGGEANESQK